MAAWWQSFFDADYLQLWASTLTPERTATETAQLWDLLELEAGSRVLDAPCGSGRISRALAERGAVVLGVDQSAELLADAERTRAGIGDDRLRYLRADLRQPLADTGFDVALNIFSSLGYGDDDDDLAILTTLARAVRPGGSVVVETNHRDWFIARAARGDNREHTFPDGTRFWETPRLDAVRGRVETTWHWSGPAGEGTKDASIRVYTITELVRLVERAGLTVQSVNAGLSREPYNAEPPAMGGRVAIVARSSRSAD